LDPVSQQWRNSHPKALQIIFCPLKNINIYLTVENSVNKNITIQKADESPTTILVNDI
jgi:hypothetical protein